MASDVHEVKIFVLVQGRYKFGERADERREHYGRLDRHRRLVPVGGTGTPGTDVPDEGMARRGSERERERNAVWEGIRKRREGAIRRGRRWRNGSQRAT